MRLAEPVHVLHLFPEERAYLLELLRNLEQPQWALPTVCSGWSVGDIVRHLLGDDLGHLSRVRDGYTPPQRAPVPQNIADLVNELNAQWVASTRRLSHRVLCELLAVTGEWIYSYLASLDLDATGPVVSWAGPEAAPVWLDVAREYTERWHHQQQIREAVNAPGLDAPHLFHPVLATFVYALPFTFRNTDAEDGSTVHLHISGAAGGDWSIRRENARWRLYIGAPEAPTAQVVMSRDIAWRLFTKGLSPASAAQFTLVEGDQKLGRRVLQTVSVIA